jgi:hypothetical protein
MTLLISESTKVFGLGIAFFLLMLGVSLIAYSLRKAECYEPKDDVPGEDMEPVTYAEIMDVERPYYQYN